MKILPIQTLAYSRGPRFTIYANGAWKACTQDQKEASDMVRSLYAQGFSSVRVVRS